MIGCAKDVITPTKEVTKVHQLKESEMESVPADEIAGSRSLDQIIEEMGEKLKESLIRATMYDSIPIDNIFIESMKVYNTGENKEGYSLKIQTNRSFPGTLGFELPIYPTPPGDNIIMHYCDCWGGGCMGLWFNNGNGTSHLECSGCGLFGSCYITYCVYNPKN